MNQSSKVERSLNTDGVTGSQVGLGEQIVLTNRELVWTNQTNQTIKQQKEKVILCGCEPFDNFDHLDHFGHIARAFVIKSSVICKYFSKGNFSFSASPVLIFHKSGLHMVHFSQSMNIWL